MDVIAELVGRLGFEVDDKGLDDFDRKMKRGEKSASSFSDKLKGGITTIAKYGAAAVAAGAALLTGLIVNVAAAGDEIAKTAGKIGAGTTELQRLRFAAQRSGAEAATLDKAIRKLNVGLVDAATKGTGPTAEGLDAIGLSASALEGLTVEEKLGQISEALRSVADDGERSAVAAKIFGERAGPELLPLLDQGAAGIAALGDRAEALGGVLGDKALKDSEAFQDAILDLKTAAMGAGAGLVSGLIPQVTEAANGIADWAAENDEFIRQDLPAALEKIVGATIDVVKFFVEAATQVDDFVAEVEDLAETFNDEYGPAIDAAVTAGEALVDVWADIASGIGVGIAKLLELVGVLEDAERTIYSVKVGLGLDDTPTTSVSGAPRPGESEEDRVSRRRDEQAREEAREQAGENLSNVITIARAFGQRYEQIQQAQESAGNGRGRGGRGGGRRGRGGRGRGGGGGRRRPAGADGGILEPAPEASEDPNADIIAMLGGEGGSRGLSEALGEAIGGRRESPAGGGASPTAGAKFVRVEVNVGPTTITIEMPENSVAGLSPDEVMQVAEERIGAVLEERNRRAFDHFASAAEI